MVYIESNSILQNCPIVLLTSAVSQVSSRLMALSLYNLCCKKSSKNTFDKRTIIYFTLNNLLKLIENLSLPVCKIFKDKYKQEREKW